jgi:hypothetical protein
VVHIETSLNRHGGGGIDSGRRYSRLFDLPPCTSSNKALSDLADSMRTPDSKVARDDNSDVLAGYTYLGQFVAHEITFDPTPSSAAHATYATNYRTPSIDLDSLYGLGPELQPHLYCKDGLRFWFGKTAKSYLRTGLPHDTPHDLPRLPNGTAVIGDPRNDENLIVAQLHVALMHLHNNVVREIGGREETKRLRFNEAKRIVTWHIQWIIVNQYLPRIVRGDVLERILKSGPRWFPLKKPTRIPLEFSAAAFRFGHAMVRSKYDVNDVFSADKGSVRQATLRDLLENTGRYQSSIRAEWVIDWRRFFEFRSSKIPVNHANRISPAVSDALYDLPDVGSLPFSTLKRGDRVGLPSGQRLAEAMGIEPMTSEEISDGVDGMAALRHGLHWETPLWYYILKEAEKHGIQKAAGRSKKKVYRLGELGSTIVSEVILGILFSDSSSYLARDPNWKPELPHDSTRGFHMEDLLKYVPS